MKKVMSLLLVILLVGCLPTAPQGTNVSSEPKVIEKLVVQCWDNSTADTESACPQRFVPVEKETIKEAPVGPTPTENNTGQTVNVAQQYLDAAQKTFEAYAYQLNDRTVVVAGPKSRHLLFRLVFFENNTPYTDVYVDTDAKTAVAYCDIEREARMGGATFDYDRSRCKDYVNVAIPLNYDAWTSRGPLDYLADFASKTPILVENNVQTISIGGTSKTIQPSLHYMVEGKRIILRLDQRYHVPIKIEREGERSIDFRDTFFDVMILDGKQEKIKKDFVVYHPVSDYWKKQ